MNGRENYIWIEFLPFTDLIWTINSEWLNADDPVWKVNMIQEHLSNMKVFVREVEISGTVIV